jgi:hypothetical protein
MKRSIFKSWYLATVIFAVPARALAVWPPSTSFEAEAAAPAEHVQGGSLPPALHQHVQALASKLEQDERRLEEVIQDLKDDRTALSRLSQDVPDAHGGSHQPSAR